MLKLKYNRTCLKLLVAGLGDDLLHLPHEPLARHVERLEFRTVEAQHFVFPAAAAKKGIRAAPSSHLG